MAADVVPQILAMGGGGFSMEQGNELLDRYILSLARTDLPAVCYLPTASGDSAENIARFHTAYGDLPCRASHLTLFNATPADLRALLLSQDVIYVGGGNTRSMLA